MSSKKIISYVMRGNSHIEDGSMCEDVVSSQESASVVGISLADGAGSAAYALEGAQIAVKIGTSWLIRHFDEIKNDISQSARRLQKTINAKLRVLAKRKGTYKTEFNSTFLAIVIKDDEFVIAHVGDGVIGCISEGKSSLISAPEKGEFANMTFFTTSSKSHYRLHFGKLGQIEGFFCMSDGSADCLYNPVTGTFANAISKIFTNLKTHPNTEEASNLLMNVMENHFRLRTNDDCSLIMINI